VLPTTIKKTVRKKKTPNSKIWRQNINIFLCVLHQKINVENSFFSNGDAVNPIVFHALFVKILNTKYFMLMC
jgi:hypothetical protein